MRVNVKHRPVKFQSIVPKGSETKRSYMRRRYGHRVRALHVGKPIYFPPRVFNEIQVACLEMAKSDHDRPYVYAYELIWEAIQNI
jgi:hypothetical protein